MQQCKVPVDPLGGSPGSRIQGTWGRFRRRGAAEGGLERVRPDLAAAGVVRGARKGGSVDGTACGDWGKKKKKNKGRGATEKCVPDRRRVTASAWWTGRRVAAARRNEAAAAADARAVCL